MRDLVQQLVDAVDRWRRFVTRDIWYIGRPGEAVPQGLIIKQIRVVILLVRNLIEDQLLLRAAALTFVTALAIVPFLMFLVGYPLALWASRMPSDPPTEAVAPPIRHVASAVRTMRRNDTLIDFAGLLTATLAAVFVLHGLGLTVSPLFLDLEFGVPVETRGLIVGTFQFGIILVAARISRIRARYGGNKTMTAAFMNCCARDPCTTARANSTSRCASSFG